LRIAEWRIPIVGIALAGLSAAAVQADTYADRAAQVASLSSEQKAELLRKKDRFDKLTDVEKERLRALHAELSASSDAAALSSLMGRYCNWLKGLAARDRDEVLSLPADERIKRIKEIVSRQEAQRFSEYVTYHLPKSDQDAIYQFLDSFVAKHEKEIVDRLREDDRRRVKNIEEDKARRRTLIQRLPMRRFDSKMPFPSNEETDQMVLSLSKETQSKLDAPGATGRGDRVRELVGAAIMSIAMPPPSEDDLLKFFASLPSEDKGRLEEMDPEKMQQALRYKYRAMQFQSGGRAGPWGGWRGDGQRRDDSRGPRSPPGPPPPGFASPK
jgi:hypothetical protein